MQTTAIVSIEGYSAFHGLIDGDPTVHDTLRIFVLEPVRSTNVTNTGGCMTVVYKFQEGSRFLHLLKDKNFPMSLQMTMEIESKLQDGRPVQSLKPVALEPLPGEKPSDDPILSGKSTKANKAA